jgi:mono/diheme cytochrome c family protein
MSLEIRVPMLKVAVMVLVMGIYTGGVTGKAAGVTTEIKPQQEGHRLFDNNCAHCHGEDARGDEGPDLHDLRKSDGRIEKIIKGGIKGEMPQFGKKFTDNEVKAIIAYLRTLKN